MKTCLYWWERRKQTLQNGICPLQVTFSQLTACSPEHVPFSAAVHPNVPHCQCSFISLCVLKAFREVHEESSYEKSNIASTGGLVAFLLLEGWTTESMNCANRSDHQAPGQQVHFLNTIEIPLVEISDLERKVLALNTLETTLWNTLLSRQDIICSISL